MIVELTDRVAIVTGGGAGIGAAICKAFIEAKAKVIVADVNAEEAERTAKVLRESGGDVLPFTVDITDESAVQSLIEFTVKQFGGVHILVNNAGFTRDMKITRMGLADWNSVIDVILKGAFLCSRVCIPIFKEQRYGRIINISSRAHLGNPGQANYSAAKAGLIGFTRAMSLENGAHLVTVNAVAPGIIDTEAVRRLPHYSKIRESAERTLPIPRIGEPQDVANAVTFLASDKASYISGEVLHVTGGRY